MRHTSASRTNAANAATIKTQWHERRKGQRKRWRDGQGLDRQAGSCRRSERGANPGSPSWKLPQKLILPRSPTQTFKHPENHFSQHERTLQSDPSRWDRSVMISA